MQRRNAIRLQSGLSILGFLLNVNSAVDWVMFPLHVLRKKRKSGFIKGRLAGPRKSGCSDRGFSLRW